LFSLQQMATLLATLPDPAFVLTRSGRYVAVLGGTDKRYYHDGTNLVGQTIADVLQADKAAWFLQAIASALAEPDRLHVVEYNLAASDVKGLDSNGPSQPIWFEGRVRALEFLVHDEEAVLWVASNITVRHELELQLRAQSETDALTGLPNRRKLMRELDALFRRMQGQCGTSTVLVFDIDNFKSINDVHGHLVGDQVIRLIADICADSLRHGDLVARFGGDEFVVLLPDTSLLQAQGIADRLRRRLAAQAARMPQPGIQITISGGLGELLPDDHSFQQAIQRADEALFLAKRAGKDRIGMVCPPAT